MKIRLATLTCLLIAKGAVAQTLVNPSFEVPDVYLAGAGVAVAGAYQQGSGTPVMAGWRTTNTGGLFEVWTNLQSYAPGIQAYDGNQWIELNADQVAEVYQDLSGVASGTKVGFNFAHRGRAGVDVMEMQVVDLGTDGVYGTGDDTVLFDQTYSDDKTAWGVYQNPQPITSLGHVLRMRFISISSKIGRAHV